MNLQKGQILDSGFSVIDIVDLAEMQATGIWAKHQKSGVEVFHVLNDDSENLFAFAFATSAEDNTGVTHIIEHSVLCGSERYPLKDAFLVLAQGSLQTFLNAWTFPDKTVYPASSVNEHDYFNLMSVYGDAVFRPLLSEWTFMQEGHRYEFAKDGPNKGKLSITGVVYNEMKGAYSSLDAYAGLWSVKAVLPDTPYRFESGGNPEYIPQLSWEGLKDFHRRRYSPANCRVFLAGNIPTEKQLAFLNEQFFSSIKEKENEGGMVSPPINKQKRWTAPQEFHVPCPADDETKSTVFLSWLCTDTTDNDEFIALIALAEILLGHDGSPLLKTLVESGLGEDISPVSGPEGELGETLFVAGLRGVGGSVKKKGVQIENLILNELRRLVTEGIPQGEIEAALLSIEFSQREIKRSGGPFSLVWMRRSLRAWLHGGKPWDSLLLTPPIEKIKRHLAEDARYFESLIQKLLLDNPHRALVMLEPQKNFLPKQEARLAETLKKVERNLSAADREKIIQKTVDLEKIQSTGDSPEALAAIPHLSRSDLSPEPEIIPRRFEELQSAGTSGIRIPALCHDLYTNGITYIDLAFPVDLLPLEDYLWLPFFTRAINSVGLPNMNYAEVSSLMAHTMGGCNAVLHTASSAETADTISLTGRDWLIYHLKCLDEKTGASLDIVRRLINETDFSDTRRIRDLVLEMKNEARSSLAPHGHNYASCRAGRFASPSTQVAEIWNGITQLEFVHRLAGLDIVQIADKLKSMREAIVASGIIVNITGSAEAIKSGGALIAQRFGNFGSPRLPAIAHNALSDKAGTPVGKPEVFASPSLQIGFAAMTLKAAVFDTPVQTAESVLAHQLSTGALWEDIRMKGGAYGANASGNSLERCFSLSTYRDPNPLRSLDSFSTILKNGCSINEDLDKLIIGCYSRETRPHSPVEKGATDFARFLSHIENDYLKRKLQRLISVSADDISAAMKELASQEAAGRVIIAGTKIAQQAAKALGVDVQVLPV